MFDQLKSNVHKGSRWRHIRHRVPLFVAADIYNGSPYICRLRSTKFDILIVKLGEYLPGGDDMKVNQDLILLIMILFPFTVLDVQIDDEHLENLQIQKMWIMCQHPSSASPFAHEPVLQNPLPFPDDYTYSVGGK